MENEGQRGGVQLRKTSQKWVESGRQFYCIKVEYQVQEKTLWESFGVFNAHHLTVRLVNAQDQKKTIRMYYKSGLEKHINQSAYALTLGPTLALMRKSWF